MYSKLIEVERVFQAPIQIETLQSSLELLQTVDYTFIAIATKKVRR